MRAGGFASAYTSEPLKVLEKLQRASRGKENDQDKDDRQNWDLKQDAKHLEEGIDGEIKHFEENRREETEFGKECQKEAEATVPDKIKIPTPHKLHFSSCTRFL